MYFVLLRPFQQSPLCHIRGACYSNHIFCRFLCLNRSTMAHHLDPIVIKIVGIEVGDHARNCKEHSIYYSVVGKEDAVMWLQKVQVLV